MASSLLNSKVLTGPLVGPVAKKGMGHWPTWEVKIMMTFDKCINCRFVSTGWDGYSFVIECRLSGLQLVISKCPYKEGKDEA